MSSPREARGDIWAWYDRGRRPLLVGESNATSADPRLALWPEPAHRAGGRLCRLILGMTPRAYLRAFRRVNLCRGPWDRGEAVVRAREIVAFCRAQRRRVILLGARVTRIFVPGGRAFAAYYVDGVYFLVLPHPSGRCRAWNDPRAFRRARAAIRAFCPGS